MLHLKNELEKTRIKAMENEHGPSRGGKEVAKEGG